MWCKFAWIHSTKRFQKWWGIKRRRWKLLIKNVIWAPIKPKKEKEEEKQKEEKPKIRSTSIGIDLEISKRIIKWGIKNEINEIKLEKWSGSERIWGDSEPREHENRPGE